MRRDVDSDARALVAARIGFVIPAHYAERIDSALHRAAQTLDLADSAAALSKLETLPIASPAWQQVIAAVTIGETNFFRHAKWFSHIEGHDLLFRTADLGRGTGARRGINPSSSCHLPIAAATPSTTNCTASAASTTPSIRLNTKLPVVPSRRPTCSESRNVA
jgi:hypothetical protein